MTLHIDVHLVKSLIKLQFPAWSDLPINPVETSGWDNRTFHLGSEMTVRLPSASDYALQVEKEQRWLPYLAPHLTIQIPIPIAMGKPTEHYPWPWSIYQWLEGQTVSTERISNMTQFAVDLANFLVELQNINPSNGPTAGEHSFFRGGPLVTYDSQMQEAIKIISKQMDTTIIARMWAGALNTTWQKKPVWVHGDIAVGNLLVKEGKLCAVIDFGQLAIGDPACDLVIAWTFLNKESRLAFRDALGLDNDTWVRARGWALWKALIVCAKLVDSNPLDRDKFWNVIKEIIATETEFK